jgi:hypothetical protein
MWAMALVALSLVVVLGSSKPAIEEQAALPATGPLASFGTFAGYVTSANVSTISAQWRVPVLLPTSKNGEAATWIGAQGSSSPLAFIQIGTIESRINGETIEPTESDSAFWSDTHLDYYPVTITGLVHGGELIRAEMIATAVGWRL